MAVSQVLEIPQDIFDSARLTPAELKVEMAIHLYAEGRFPLARLGS